jgi:hypothetical protein
LILLFGGLALIGVSAVVLSLIILQSQGPGEAEAQRLALEGDVDGDTMGVPADGSATQGGSASGLEERSAPTNSRSSVGSVLVSANPGTRIYIDGELAGTIPPEVRVQLEPGPHHIRYVIPEYDEFEETVEVRAGKDNAFSHQFASFGVLRVVCQPYAQVRVDGREVGFTPVNLRKVREGEHQIVLYRGGYRTIEKTVRIQPDQINLFKFSLVHR